MQVARKSTARRIWRKVLSVGLLDTFLAPARPEALIVSEATGSVYAPATGFVVPLGEVSDPVFSQGMLGEGLAIERPVAGVAYAPVSGTVTAVVASKHAVAIRAASGAEVLLHVGVDTVRLRGKGFTCYVGKGDVVRAGEALIVFDDELIRSSGLDDSIIVTVTNSSEVGPIEAACTGEVRAGETLLHLGVRVAAGALR
jgi:sugar PTS system EIIA component